MDRRAHLGEHAAVLRNRRADHPILERSETGERLLRERALDEARREFACVASGSCCDSGKKTRSAALWPTKRPQEEKEGRSGAAPQCLGGAPVDRILSRRPGADALFPVLGPVVAAPLWRMHPRSSEIKNNFILEA